MSPCLLRSANTTPTPDSSCSPKFQTIAWSCLVLYKGRARSAKAMPSVSSPSIRRGELGVPPPSLSCFSPESRDGPVIAAASVTCL